MIDANDVSDAGLYGGVAVAAYVTVIVLYLVFSVPEINECHEKGGQIVRIEGKDKCMDTSVLKEVK